MRCHALLSLERDAPAWSGALQLAVSIRDTGGSPLTPCPAVEVFLLYHKMLSDESILWVGVVQCFEVDRGPQRAGPSLRHTRLTPLSLQ